jgi:hypothetical protein
MVERMWCSLPPPRTQRRDGEHNHMPGLIADRSVWAFSILYRNFAAVFYRPCSQDDGLNWSETREIFRCR